MKSIGVFGMTQQTEKIKQNLDYKYSAYFKN